MSPRFDNLFCSPRLPILLIICALTTGPWCTSIRGQESTDKNPYNPLQIDDQETLETVLFEIEYRPEAGNARSNQSNAEMRKVPLKVYLPKQKTPAPVVLFSHGLGGSREGFKHGGEHFARRGYVAVFLQHPGSDESVWKNSGVGKRMTAMREAANGQNLILRVQDVKAVIDALERIERGDTGVSAQAQVLRQRMDLKHIGMSGHSFGAVTTQMVSGQSPAIPNQQPTDPRISAAVVLSPSSPRIGQPERSFGKVSIPWMLMTGTEDSSPIGDQTPESRLKVFPALPEGKKYQVVFHGGTHAFLGERASVLAINEEPSSHARATVALATAFWDATLSGNEEAQRWLDGDGPRGVLAPKDVWQKK